MLKTAVSVQADATIRRWIVIDSKSIATRSELTTRRWCSDNCNTVALRITLLMYVSEEGKSYTTGCRYPGEEFVGISEPNRVQPSAAHRDRRVMQTHHYVGHIRAADFCIESIQFGHGNVATGFAFDTTVDTGDEPVAVFDRLAVVKFVFSQYVLHDRANVMIARYAVHRQFQRPEQFAKVLIGTGAVILDKVTGRNDDISTPFLISVMLQSRVEGCISRNAAQLARGIGKQVWIRQVQDP